MRRKQQKRVHVHQEPTLPKRQPFRWLLGCWLAALRHALSWHRRNWPKRYRHIHETPEGCEPSSTPPPSKMPSRPANALNPFSQNYKHAILKSRCEL